MATPLRLAASKTYTTSWGITRRKMALNVPSTLSPRFTGLPLQESEKPNGALDFLGGVQQRRVAKIL